MNKNLKQKFWKIYIEKKNLSVLQQNSAFLQQKSTMALTRIQKQEVSSTSKKPWLFHIVLLFFMSVTSGNLSTGSDTIFPGESLSGNQTIISKGGVFELGFFTPGNSLNYYIGIWYKGLPIPNKTVVWVANRNQPVSDPSSSTLHVTAVSRW